MWEVRKMQSNYCNRGSSTLDIITGLICKTIPGIKLKWDINKKLSVVKKLC